MGYTGRKIVASSKRNEGEVFSPSEKHELRKIMDFFEHGLKIISAAKGKV